jgi:hypothetical protein
VSVTQDGVVKDYWNDAHGEIEPPNMREFIRQLNINRDESISPGRITSRGS